jgi:hypothetical protein
MSSLKSLSAAKTRRGNEQQHVMSGTRPGTSIASHGAFAQQYQQPSRGNQLPPQMLRQQPQQSQQSQQNMYNSQQDNIVQQNGLPFSKLTVSDAIGLITLRLGKVEQFIIDLENGETSINKSDNSSIPDNCKIIDNCVLTNIVTRLDSLEKKELNGSSNNEICIKLDKELKETKELLMNLMFKLELFTKETTGKFDEHSNAILELDQNMKICESDLINENDLINGIDFSLSTDPEAEKILSAELKTIIKQELSNIDL